MVLTPAAITANDIQGVWKRDWIEKHGKRTRNTQVLWAQAGHLFVDIRIPQNRPATRGYVCLADLSPKDLDALRHAEGFSGSIDIKESVCTWRREINWHGIPEEVDAGELHFNEAGALIETGVHARYSEQWQQFEKTPLRAWRVRTKELRGIVIFSDRHFYMGLGIPVKELQLVGNSAPREEIAHHFISEYAFGSWDGKIGVAELSTNPFREQKQVITKESGKLFWHRQGFQGYPEVAELHLL